MTLITDQLDLAAWEQEPRGPGGQWVEMYHGTKAANAPGIKFSGLTAERYSHYNNVLTKRKDEAGYFAGKNGAVVTVRIPVNQLDEYTEGGAQGLRSLKKPLPPSMIHKVEDINTGVELGWRFDPDEPRDAHGQWTRGGKGYIAPDHERLILPHAPKNTRWPYYRAPEDHPFFRAHPVSAVNIVASYDASSAQEREQGMRWYADAGLLARAIAHGDAAKGAGLLASYSPQAPWPANMFNAARSMELGHAIGHEAGMITGSMQEHAQRILDGEPNDKVFGKNSAPKIRAFAHLIEHGGDDPGEQLGNVVIDRHAMSVATGTRLPKKEADAAPIGTDRYYQHVADQYRLAALEISRRGTPVTPHQVQAVTWLHQQSANAAEDETGAEIHGGKGAGRGRQVMQRNAWTRWNTAAQTQHLPVHQGTTALAGLITSQLDLTGDGHGHHIPGTPYVYRHGWKEIQGGPAPPSFVGSSDSKSVHTRPDGQYTAERLALHRQIIRQALAGHKPEHSPRAIFLGGGPASGKSTITSKLDDPGVMINADDIMEQLPEYRQMVAGGDPMASTFNHREAADIADQMQAAAISRWISFTLDGTGDRSAETMQKRIDAVHKEGYQAIAQYVTTDTDVAVQRAAQRAKQTGRMVPEAAIRAIHASVSDIFRQLTAQDAFDKAELWDNNGPAPRLVGDKEDPAGYFSIKDPGAWQRFVEKAGDHAGAGRSGH